jgi:trehalose/maltose hydrolase-like predicted phosphorylase
LEEAYRNFIITTGMDLDEGLTGRHDTHAGLHGTAAGGAWLAAVFGFGGVCLADDGLRLDPRLPPAWSGLRFSLVYQGVPLHVALDREELAITASDARAHDVQLTVAGERVSLKAGQTRVVRYTRPA